MQSVIDNQGIQEWMDGRQTQYKFHNATVLYLAGHNNRLVSLTYIPLQKYKKLET